MKSSQVSQPFKLKVFNRFEALADNDDDLMSIGKKYEMICSKRLRKFWVIRDKKKEWMSKESWKKIGERKKIHEKCAELSNSRERRHLKVSTNKNQGSKTQCKEGKETDW